MKCIGRPVAERWPFKIFPRWRQPPSWICLNRSGSDDWLRRYRHLKFLQHGDGCHLGFAPTVNSAVRSAIPRKPYPGTKHEVDWITRCRDMANWPFAYVGAYGTPILGGRGGRRGSAMAPLERAMVVSYVLSIVTVALSVTIRPQFAIECLQRSNQRGGSLWAQI